MKRLILISVILALVVGASLTTLGFLKSYSRQTADALLEIAQIAGEDTAAAQKRLSAVQTQWDRAKALLGISVHEENLRDFSRLLEEASALLRGENTSEAQILLEQAADEILYLYQRELPTPENVLSKSGWK